MFQKLTEKQIEQVRKHKEKNGTRSANVYRANLMRGKSHKEADKIAKARVAELPPRRARRKKGDVAPELQPEVPENVQPGQPDQPESV